jgi:hypothetical protein
MQRHYVPPKSAFDPLELNVMKKAFDAAWAEISGSTLVDGNDHAALKTAVCVKLFSLVRTRPSDPYNLRDFSVVGSERRLKP